MDREIDEEGNFPEGRAVSLDGDHPIAEPPELEGENIDPPEGDNDHDRALGYYRRCTKCWYNRYYGWIAKCCTYYGSRKYCKYYYC